jgi:hypothetical protein
VSFAVLVRKDYGTVKVKLWYIQYQALLMIKIRNASVEDKWILDKP